MMVYNGLKSTSSTGLERPARVMLLLAVVVAPTAAAAMAPSLPSSSLPPSFSSSSSPFCSTFAGEPMEPQPWMPAYLHQYHSRSLELTEQALLDETIQCTRNVQYGPEPRQLLDVWRPAGTSADLSQLPVLVSLHGGGWMCGYKEWAGFVASQVCCRSCDTPAIVVTPTYRLPKNRQDEGACWPDNRNDIVQALKWIQANAADLGADPTKIFLSGHSAGGHLAASVGLNPSLLQDAGIAPENIKGLFLQSTPLGLRETDWPSRSEYWRTVVPIAMKPLFGSNDDTLLDGEALSVAANDMSPLYHARRAVENCEDSFVTFVHVIHGGVNDFAVNQPHAEKLRDLLGQEVVEILHLPEANHFQTHFDLANRNSEWYSALQRAIQRT